MAVLAIEIENVRREIDKTNISLENLYQKLGSIACNYHKAIACSESDNVFKDICNLIEKRDEISTYIDAVNNAVEKRQGSGSKIEQSTLSVKDLETKYNTLLSSLGAICSEIYTAGQLPQSLCHCMTDFDSYRKKEQELEEKLDQAKAVGSALSVSIAKGHLKKHRKQLDEVFHETGKAILYSNKARCIPGEGAQSILDSIDDTKNLKKNYKSVIKDSKNAISEATSSLKTIGAEKSEGKTLRELSSKEKSIQEELNSLFIQYGEIISKSMDRWLDDMAPAALKTICEEIKREKRHLLRLNLNLEFFDIDKQADVHSKQVEIYEQQISALENQKALIEKQILELNSKIDIETNTIEVIRNKQHKLESQATENS